MQVPWTQGRDPMSRLLTIYVIIIVIILVFSSGCIHTKKETDLFAAKMNSNGTLMWVQVIDSGQNDVFISLTETPEGGYLITGGSYPSICGSDNSPSSTPYEVRLSSQGNIDSFVHFFSGRSSAAPLESFNRSGWFSMTAADGSRLTTYVKNKGNAVYYRMERTDAEGERLWDTPFLTLKKRSGPTEISENIVVHGIVPTSDNGYIIWGHRERATTC